jgi:hypothetical protein
VKGLQSGEDRRAWGAPGQAPHLKHEPGLRAVAEALCSALTRLQCTVAETYLGEAVIRDLADPTPTDRDRAAAATVDRHLAGVLGAAEPPTEPSR